MKTTRVLRSTTRDQPKSALTAIQDCIQVHYEDSDKIHIPCDHSFVADTKSAFTPLLAETLSDDSDSVISSVSASSVSTVSVKENGAAVKGMNPVNVDMIESIPTAYPDEFVQFCTKNKLRPPGIKSKNGKALAAMLLAVNKYWNRETCDAFVRKFGIETKDSIQLFNKHSQWGIKTNSGIERNKLYIVYPYALSNKYKMRKNFKYDGSEETKIGEIERIKSTIRTDYIDVPAEMWQLGHRNPGSTDNTNDNLVLQPPIQAKYRDDYVFIDTLTKFPLPKKLESMATKGEVVFTRDQLQEYKRLFEKMLS